MNKKIDVSVINTGQLDIVRQYKINKLYIPFDLFYLKEIGVETIDEIHSSGDTKVYLSLPEIIREKDAEYLKAFKDLLLKGKADGVLVRNLEEIEYIYEAKEELNSQFISLNGANPDFTPLLLDSDASIYTWNIRALEFLKNYCQGLTAPCELSLHELKDLKASDLIIPVYGHSPLMKSANCVKKTSGKCDHNPNFIYEYGLKDRKNITSPVISNCVHCFNIIYNSVPTSLHKYIEDFQKSGFSEFRLDFTIEDSQTLRQIMNYYCEGMSAFPLVKYTGGHIQKGAI